MKASVVIPAYNEARHLPGCIRSLRSQSLKPLEIIIVDSSSPDGTARIARRLGCRVITEKQRRGAGAARNLGGFAARGELIAFTDADSEPEKNWLERASQVFSDKRLVCAGGIAKPLEPGLLDAFYYLIFSDFYPRLSSLFGFHSFIGSNLIVRAGEFRRARGFDESLRAIEDNELGNRMKKFGRVAFDPSLVVKTSTRRFRKLGYLRQMLAYWRAGFKLYILKKPNRHYELVR